jgi:hypothetical protein
MNNKSKKLYDRYQNWSFSGNSKCPMCGKDFKRDCNHNVAEVKQWLYAQYLRSLVKC